MNRRSRMLEALGISTEWTLCGAVPAGSEAAEVTAAEPVAVEMEVDSFVAAESVPVRDKPPVMYALSGATVPRTQRIATLDWAQLGAAVPNCISCKPCERRMNTAFDVGDHEAEWMLVGEAPGEQEDKQGEPFIGQADKLLDNMLRSIGLSREKGVLIANMLKCRPSGDRDPEPSGAATRDPYLKCQIALVESYIIVVLGRIITQNLLQTQTPVGRLRGKMHEVEGVPVVMMYHPAYLSRMLTDKARVWEDLCLIRKIYVERGGQ